MKKLIFGLMALGMLGLASCSSDDNKTDTYGFNFNLAAANYGANGAWNEVYNTSLSTITVTASSGTSNSAFLQMTHSATDNDGVKNWFGFCFSESKDRSDHSGENWLDYQWGNITGGGVSGIEDGYLIVHWKADEGQMPTLASCAMTPSGTTRGTDPQSICITNTTYCYWAMKNGVKAAGGTQVCKAFGPDDWCKVIIRGVDMNNKVTGTVEFYLARYGEIVDNWEIVDLRPLGRCIGFFFSMESSDNGAGGVMNTPAYFALDNLTVVNEH